MRIIHVRSHNVCALSLYVVMENPTREGLRKFKVVELRQMLSERSLPHRGIKEELITRLLEYHEAQQEVQAAEQANETEAAASPKGDSPPVEPSSTDDQPVDEVQSLEEMDTGNTVEESKEQMVDVLVKEEVNMADKQEIVEPEAMEVTEIKQESVSQYQQEINVTAAIEVSPAVMEPSQPATVPTPQADEPVQQPSDFPPVAGNVDHINVTQTTEALVSVESITSVSNDDNTQPQAVEAAHTVLDTHPQLTEVAPDTRPLLAEATPDTRLQLAEAAPDTRPLLAEVAPDIRQQDAVVIAPTSDYYSATDSAKEEESNIVVDNEQGPPPTSHVTNYEGPPPSTDVINEEHLTPEVSRITNEQGPPPVMGPPRPLFEDIPMAAAIIQPMNDAQQKDKGKRKKKKKRRRRKHDQKDTSMSSETTAEPEPDVEIEYIQEEILKPGDPNYRQFHKIFEAFKITDKPEESASAQSVSDLVAKAAEASKKLAAQHKQESSDEDEEETEAPKISKKKLRKMNRLTVAQLKQLVDRPDVVEMHDVTAQDPKLLISLKSTRNTVPVPRHWCFKRKYLQGKRGFEKPPFDLPDFIKATGVMEMRQALEEKEEAKSLKQKTRERVRPKMGKLTIDYQKLHDAFFKWQTKPKMSIHGDLYYEGKEFETRLKQKRPGDLSDDLRRALGMPTGLGKQKFPPPWLVAMQRYGPPPSYPNLKIPGLNAPIPENCSFGYFVGGWGKPPVDEMGRPLYGDVFGLDNQDSGHKGANEDELDRSLWGELESEEEEEESEEESEEEEGEPKPEDIQAGLVTPMEGLVTPSGLTSIPAGLETPEMIQLRKKKIEEAMEQGGETPALYTVLPEMTSSVGGAMMGSSHVYDIGAAVPGAAKKTTGSLPDGIEVALDPSELDLDTATMTARYEEQLREQQNQLQKEDLSDMVAEHAAKQQKKRKRAATDTGGSKATKKLKEFKF